MFQIANLVNNAQSMYLHGPTKLAKYLPSIGATDTPRKPNYDFERRERERSKAAESVKKAKAKAEKKAAEQGTSPATDTVE